MQIGLEAGHPTEALLGRVKVVAEHHREAVGVIMDPISGSKYLKALVWLNVAFYVHLDLYISTSVHGG